MCVHMPTQAIKVLESFKSAFVHALAVTMPPALCDTCPLKQMQDLCKKLEGMLTLCADVDGVDHLLC